MRDKPRRIQAVVYLALALSSSAGLAQVKELAHIDERLGPPAFAGVPPGFTCRQPGLAIPDNAPSVGDSMVFQQAQAPPQIQVVVQIDHTWVGDLRVQLLHAVTDVGFSRTIIDRPGFTTTGFGCSGDDIDVVLSDTAGSSVEGAGAPAVPAIGGTLQPSPESLAPFGTVAPQGSWTLLVGDHAQGDVGTLEAWCINVIQGPPGPTGGTGGSGTAGNPTGGTGGVTTPATSPWGLAVLLAVFLGVSAFYVRRHRSPAS